MDSKDLNRECRAKKKTQTKSGHLIFFTVVVVAVVVIVADVACPT